MKKLDIDDLVNWWLDKYHNTNLEKVKKENPKWAENPEKYTRDFYSKYKVTQEQHDEWEEWAKGYAKKVTKLSKRAIDRSWWSVYLNASPSIINEKI